METLELFYPQIAARAGPYTLDAGKIGRAHV